jgi:hypothetical protein
LNSDICTTFVRLLKPESDVHKKSVRVRMYDKKVRQKKSDTSPNIWHFIWHMSIWTCGRFKFGIKKAKYVSWRESKTYREKSIVQNIVISNVTSTFLKLT